MAQRVPRDARRAEGQLDPLMLDHFLPWGGLDSSHVFSFDRSGIFFFFSRITLGGVVPRSVFLQFRYVDERAMSLS